MISISADGTEPVQIKAPINIKAAGKKAVLAFLQKEGFYSVLRNKLHWGISPRPY